MTTQNGVNNTLGAATALSLSFSPTTNGIVGTPTNNNVVAGSVGEFVNSVIANASAISLTTSTAANVTSISLTAGDWDVWGNVSFVPVNASTVINYITCWISSTSATVPDSSLYALDYPPQTGIFATPLGICAPSQRFLLSATTTVFLSAFSPFSINTLKACGGIYARRRR